MVTHIQAKAFAGTRGGGGGVILKKVFWIVYFNGELIVLPKIYIFLAFNIENRFHCHKVLRSGYLHSEERDDWQTFIFIENNRHLPVATINDAFKLGQFD